MIFGWKGTKDMIYKRTDRKDKKDRKGNKGKQRERKGREAREKGEKGEREKGKGKSKGNKCERDYRKLLMSNG